MAITVNKKFWTEFIDIYHSLPSLWNTKDENYNNRESRSMAWNKLVEKLHEVEPDANQDSVKRKINTFRSNFNREVRKIRQTLKEEGGGVGGVGGSDVYSPTLWYFDHLSFLLNQEKCNGISMDEHYDETTWVGHTQAKYDNVHQNETNILESMRHEGNFTTGPFVSYDKKDCNKVNRVAIMKIKLERPTISEQEESLMEYTTLTNVENVLEADTSQPKEIIIHPPHIPTIIMDNEKDKQFSEESEMQSHEMKNHSSTKKLVQSYNSSKRTKRFKTQNLYNRNHRQCCRNLTDDAHIYGQSWACGFRKLTAEQKLYAKKAIDEILVLGQLNVLKLNTVSMDSALPETGGSTDG